MSQDNHEDIQAYIHCMEEIKRRVAVVDRVLSGAANTGFVITNAELLAVQLRKIAELIALSTICSHREEYARIRDDFESDWNARLILRDVERVNPDFYPQPTRQVEGSEPGEIVKTEDIEEGYLTREELIEMVNACSEILHATNPYDEEPADPEEFIERSSEWKQQIVTLLNHHQIQLVDSDSQWWVLMEAESDGEVHVTEMKKIGEA